MPVRRNHKRPRLEINSFTRGKNEETSESSDSDFSDDRDSNDRQNVSRQKGKNEETSESSDGAFSSDDRDSNDRQNVSRQKGKNEETSESSDGAFSSDDRDSNDRQNVFRQKGKNEETSESSDSDFSDDRDSNDRQNVSRQKGKNEETSESSDGAFSSDDRDSNDRQNVSRQKGKNEETSESSHSDSSDDRDSNDGQNVSRQKVDKYNESSKSCSEEDDIDEKEPEGEDIDESDDEEEVIQVRKKQKKKDRFGGFILDEAEVDDIDESEEDWEESALELGMVSNTIVEHGPTARDIEGDRRRINLWDNKTDENIEKYLHNRYNDESNYNPYFGKGGESMSDEITQKQLLPGIRDPHLWMIKCTNGQEKATALQLMRKYITYEKTDKAFQIKSVIAHEEIKGYIYVEAYKKSHVQEFIEGVNKLRKDVIKMVPLKEMHSVLQVVNKQAGFQVNQWVRITRNIYKDDIAQIDHIDIAEKKVTLKLIPRIDYTRPRGVLRQTKQNIEQCKSKKRVPAKLFDPEAIRKIGGDISTDGDFQIFERNRYCSKGFLYKNFNTNIIKLVKPTLSELEKFEETPEKINIEISPNTINQNANNHFSVGDKVIVLEGELKNLKGQIEKIDGKKIMVKPNHEELKEAIEFRASDLKKSFILGDHVRVLTGRYQGNTGLISHVEENRVVLVTDITTTVIETRPSNIELCTEVETGVDSSGLFAMGDLVSVNGEIVGVLVRLEKDHYYVLNMHGVVVKARRQSLNKKIINKYVATLDATQKKLQINDLVKVLSGVHSEKTAKIKYIYRNFVFLQSGNCFENGGIFVTVSSALEGIKKIDNENAPTQFSCGFMSPRISSPVHPSGGFVQRGGGVCGNRGGRGRGRGRGRWAVAQTVKLIRGSYKGYVGIVKKELDQIYQVELHSSCKTINVFKSNVTFVDNPSESSSSRYSESYYGSSSCQTPQHIRDGSKTPMYESGDRTPYYGSQTPMHDGSSTPTWSGAWDVQNTPNRPTFGESSHSEPVPSTSGFNSRTSEHSSASGDHSLRTKRINGSNNQRSRTPNQYQSTPSSYVATLTPQSPEPENQQSHFQITEGLKVRIGDTINLAQYVGSVGIVKSVDKGMCSVDLHREGKLLSIYANNLVPIKPQIQDQVKVIDGEATGTVGTLIAIENNEGIIKTQENDKIIMIQFQYLCAMVKNV